MNKIYWNLIRIMRVCDIWTTTQSFCTHPPAPPIQHDRNYSECVLPATSNCAPSINQLFFRKKNWAVYKPYQPKSTVEIKIISLHNCNVLFIVSIQPAPVYNLGHLTCKSCIRMKHYLPLPGLLFVFWISKSR